MKHFIQNIIAINLGMLFSAGLIISGMTRPQNIINFLDITGHWSPTLLLVMFGAIGIYMPAYYFFIKKQQAPVFEKQFFIPTNTHLDKKLIFGSTLFGVGWGLSGLCPGPAVSSLLANSQAWIYVFSLILGMFLAKFINTINNKKQSHK